MNVDLIMDMQTAYGLLKRLNVPEHRLNDWHWLDANLHQKNSHHELYSQTIQLVRSIKSRVYQNKKAS